MQPNSFFQSNADAPAYWQVDILWLVLATGETTGDQYALLEELCPKGSGPPPHSHAQLETFYILEGELTFVVNGQMFQAGAGCYVAVHSGEVHSFRVDSATARILNSYTPAGFERTVMELGEPAALRVLPPKGLPLRVETQRVMQLFEEVGMQIVDQPDALRNTADLRMKL